MVVPQQAVSAPISESDLPTGAEGNTSSERAERLSQTKVPCLRKSVQGGS